MKNYVQNGVFAKWFTGELRIPQGKIFEFLVPDTAQFMNGI